MPGPGDTTPDPDTAPDPDDATDSGDGFEADADDGPIPWGNTSEELLDEALQQLQVLTERIGKLDELITADRHDQAGTGAGKHLRYRYERHPAGDAAAAHAELTRWVSWLVATYQLTDTVPPCWDRHDALAEELAGFYVAWQNVWADEGRYDAAACSGTTSCTGRPPTGGPGGCAAPAAPRPARWTPISRSRPTTGGPSRPRPAAAPTTASPAPAN